MFLAQLPPPCLVSSQNGNWWRQEGNFVNDELEGEYKLTRIDAATFANFEGGEDPASGSDEVRIQSIRVCKARVKQRLSLLQPVLGCASRRSSCPP